MSNKILVLAGFSGAGKDAIADALHNDHGKNFITSHTTRPMRDYESEGKPYWFIDKETMLKYEADGSLIECRIYETLVEGKKDTWYYAVHESEVQDDKSYVVVLDMLGVREFKEYFGDRVTVIFVTVPDDIREERAKLRGSFDKTEWDRRIADDAKQFTQKDIDEECDLVVQNINLEDCIKEIINYI
jgi:guanylate kinase